jgi:hypothetical protein
MQKCSIYRQVLHFSFALQDFLNMRFLGFWRTFGAHFQKIYILAHNSAADLI